MRTKSCKKCGLSLSFKKLHNGKWYPLNNDGTEHWDLCRETQLKQGKRKPMMIRSGWITGINYVPAICDCKTPPWESCDHYPDDEIMEIPM